MTKRADGKFSRKDKDKYYTPPAAIEPLLPHLPMCAYFIEPCAGDGRLAQFLESRGHTCVFACDLEPGDEYISTLDALNIGRSIADERQADMFITNPPWDRPVLHSLIEALPKVRPTWLLMDADWAHTKFGAKYGTHCAKIVSVGRVKWIEDSPHQGFDNAAWYLFDVHHAGRPEFFWKRIRGL